MIAPLLCLLLAANDAAELTRATYDLSAMLAPPTAQYAAVQALPMSIGSSDGMDFDYEEVEELSADVVVDLLYNTVSPEEWEYEGRSLEILGGDRRPRLVVTAPPAVQSEVARFLLHLERVVSRRAVLRVDVYHASGPLGADADLDGRIAAGALTKRQTFRVPVRSGEPVERASIQRRTFVRDYDVEIAQASAIHQPITDSYAVGTLAALRADFASDGRALVSYALHDAWEHDAPELLEVNGEWFVSTEGSKTVTGWMLFASRPRVSFATLAGSARLAPGERATLMTLVPGDRPGQETRVVAVLTLESLDPEPQAFSSGDRELAIRPFVGDVARGPYLGRLHRDALRGDRYDMDADEEFPFNLVLSGDGADMDAFDNTMNLMSDELGELPFGQVRHLAWVIGPRGRAAAMLDKLLSVLPRAEDARAVTATMTARATPSAQPASGVLFALEGAAGPSFVVAGVQETGIVAEDADVANNSSVGNPVVRGLVSGYAARLDGAVDLAGGPSLSMTLVSQLRRTESRPFDLGGAMHNKLDLPTFAVGVLGHRGQAAAGAPVSLGAIPLSDGEGSGEIFVTLRR